MAKQVIFTDGNELILLLKATGGRQPFNFSGGDIQRISFGRCKGGFLFGLIPNKNRRITIVAKKVGTIEFDENKHRQYFDSYLEALRKFCLDNKVTFQDFPELR